jgi:hypothetical protein
MSVSLSTLELAPARQHKTPFIAGSRLSSSHSLPGLTAREVCDARKDLDSAMRSRYYGVETAHQAARTRASSEAFQAFVSAAASQQAFATCLGRRRLKWWSFIGWRERMAADRHKEVVCFNAILASRLISLHRALEPWKQRVDLSNQLTLSAARHWRHARLAFGWRTWLEVAAAHAVQSSVNHGRRLSSLLFRLSAPFAHWRRAAPGLGRAQRAAHQSCQRALRRATALWSSEALAFKTRRDAAWFIPCRVLWHRHPLSRAHCVAMGEAVQLWACRTATEHWMRFLLASALRMWRRLELSRALVGIAVHTIRRRRAAATHAVAASHLAGGRLYTALLGWVDVTAGLSWASRVASALAARRASQLRSALRLIASRMEGEAGVRRQCAWQKACARRHRARRQRERLAGAVRGWHQLCGTRLALRLATRRATRILEDHRLTCAWVHCRRLSRHQTGCRILSRCRRRHELQAWCGRHKWHGEDRAHAVALTRTALHRWIRSALSRGWQAWLALTAAAEAAATQRQCGAGWQRRVRTRRACDAWRAALAWHTRLALCTHAGRSKLCANAWDRWRAAVFHAIRLGQARTEASVLACQRRTAAGLVRWVEWTADRLEQRAAEREALGRLQPFFLPPLSLLPFVSPVSAIELIDTHAEDSSSL